MNGLLPGITFIIPAYNEQGAIGPTVQRVHDALVATGRNFEILVVDDGSTDKTAAEAAESGKATVIRHPINAGYGRAIKSGIEISHHAWLGIVDADGTYPIEDLPDLIKLMSAGFDMAVGHRADVAKTDGVIKNLFRRVMTWTLNLILGAAIKDPNSGFRLFRRELADMFGPFLCNAFSFTTSITIFAVGNGNFVGYTPIIYSERKGRSKVRHLRDTMRMVQLILQGITFYNPIKFYLILVLLLFGLVVIPALILFLLQFPYLSFGYLLVGVASAVLVGMGMLGDINRISSGIRSAEIAPPTHKKDAG